jgi:CubicO group peptidase (beta-lactamase class C family)
MGINWGLGMYSGSNDAARAEAVGIREFMASGPQSAWTGRNVPADLEHSRFPGLQAGLAWIWDDGGSRRAFRDQTKAQLDQRMQGARPAGERPVDFEARSTSSGMAYSTVWSSNVEGIDWRVSYDLTASQYGTEFQSWRAAGYRLVDMEAYQTPSGLRYAAIWWASCDGSNWKQVRDMSRQGYQNRVTSESQQGFRVVDFESYQTSAGQRYAAIWERVPSDRGWAVRTDRGLKQFLNYHHDYVDQGMRLLDYEAYDTANGPRYAGVWIENEPRYDFAFRPAVDSVITRYRDSVGVPGISVVVMQDDEVIYRRGFGWADSVQQKEAHSGTIYITASVAKAIGGTIAARLEERGLIDLSRTSRSYLSGMPPEHTHTVEQLLAKTGCVRHYPELRSRGRPDTTRAYSWHLPVAQRVWRDSLLQNPSCTPGTRYHYSTHGYVFVDAILEEVTGKPVADILRDELTSPFGLTSMGPMVSGRWGGFGALGVRPYDLARAYRRHPTKPAWREAVNYENGTWKFFGGGLQTNARDLARFGWLTLDGQIVSASTRDTRLWSRLTNGTVRWTNGNPPTPTALAWVVRGRGPRVTTSSGSRNRRVAEHGGTARGAKSTLRLYRDEGLTIAILSNQRDDLSSAAGTDHTPETLATRIARQVFANPPPP